MPPPQITPQVVTELRRICGGTPAIEVQFRRTARFPGVLYLDPEPAAPLAALTGALAARWPQAPPYGGAFDEVIPHLTVAQGAPADVLDGIEADLERSLPIGTRLAEAWLYVLEGGRWRPHARLPFQP